MVQLNTGVSFQGTLYSLNNKQDSIVKEEQTPENLDFKVANEALEKVSDSDKVETTDVKSTVFLKTGPLGLGGNMTAVTRLSDDIVEISTKKYPVEGEKKPKGADEFILRLNKNDASYGAQMKELVQNLLTETKFQLNYFHLGKMGGNDTTRGPGW